MYLQGVHVKPDNKTALDYYKRGMDRGSPIAMNGYAYMRLHGMHIAQDHADAIKFFSQAAEQGNQEARFNLGALHIAGYGVQVVFVYVYMYIYICMHDMI
jgi:TPR repeat protein